MSATTEEPQKKNVSLTPDSAFKLVCDKMNQTGCHMQINLHIKAVSGKPSIALYHADKSIADADKIKLYKECFSAIHHKNLASLQGQGNVGKGNVRVDPLEDAPIELPVKKEAATPATTPESPRATQSASASEAKVTPPKRAVKPVETGTDTDDAALQLARSIKRLMGGDVSQPAPIDESQIETIVAQRLELFAGEYDEALGEKIKKHLGNGAFPTDRVKELFEQLSSNLVRRIEFITPNGEVKPIEGLMHPQVPQLVAWLMAGVPVWAWGAAGAGKTHLARQVAAMLTVNPHIVSVDPTLTVAKLMGYRNVANGDFIEGFIYKPFKEGALLAMDEIDTGDPGVIASANALLSNEHYLFPNNETVAKHPKFYTLALANTCGMGAVAGYVARNRLDAATLDRFAIIELKYDTGLEGALACGVGTPSAPWKPCKPASPKLQAAFVEWVQKIRSEFGSSILLSPRASINGCKALRVGIPINEVADAVVLKLCVADTKSRILAKFPIPDEN